MLFNSFSFLFLFFPLVLLVALRLRGQALLRWIALSSFGFYALAGHVWFLIPMLVTTTIDFLVAPVMARQDDARKRKAWLLLSLCCNLGLLFYFKYSRLLLSALPDAWRGLFTVILPAGISFYTFQTISYMVDVYRREAVPETNFWRFVGFVSFFPHLVAGPLTRHDQLIPPLTRISEEGVRPMWREGVFLFCVGLAKKILIADRIAELIDPILDHAVPMTFSTGWAALLGYSLQIYFDFSGYSDMAIGLGRLFGIELPKNFNSPYQALNPSDFWRRWHMTLSAWLRDYLYIPLGGSRFSEARRRFNLMLTMVLGGLWHGANWTFAAWGFYHGLLLLIYHAAPERWARAPVWAQRAATFLLVTLGWVFFRAENFGEATAWLRALSGQGEGLAPAAPALWALLAAGLALAQFFPNAAHYPRWRELSPARQALLGAVSVAALLMINASSRFLYFQF